MLAYFYMTHACTPYHVTAMLCSLCVQVCDDDLHEFCEIVGAGNVLTTAKGDDLDPYNVDWLHNHRWVGVVVLH